MTAPPEYGASRPRPLSRRRMLLVTGAACAAPFPASRAFAAEAAGLPAYAWRGAALGVTGRITIFHPNPRRARAVVGHCVAELRRLERIFSLYDAGSELCRLNRDGRLARASLDMRLLLAEARRLGAITDGAFDVTVQPLWRLYAAHFRSPGADPAGPAPAAVAAARRRVDYRRIDVSGTSVGFLAPGMAVTTNGIAQGYIDDRIGDILRNEGIGRALIDIGEISGLGTGGDGPGWRVGIGLPGRNGPAAEIALEDGALATSRGAATAFDASGRHHHLFDPATGASAGRHRQVTVVAPRAALADALATALAVLPAEKAASVLAKAGAGRALIVPHHGAPRWVLPA